MSKIATWKNFDSFVSLVISYSPENVHRDGEASKTEVKKTIARLNREWKQLEKLEGKKVTEDDIWGAFLEARKK